ncbi:hypothetical protein BJS_03547 [Bradyrhizobium japonicum SEMIA 5079]|nr:hypothetical protein BJS_03547 [Bradyrhizobium japonicum SEMIA 5079]
MPDSRRPSGIGDAVFNISGWKRFGFHETQLHEPRHDFMVECRRADPGFAKELPQKIALQIGQFHSRTPLAGSPGGQGGTTLWRVAARRRSSLPRRPIRLMAEET